MKALILLLVLVSCGDSTITHEVDLDIPEDPIIVEHVFSLDYRVSILVDECFEDHIMVSNQGTKDELVNICIFDKLETLIGDIRSEQ